MFLPQVQPVCIILTHSNEPFNLLQNDTKTYWTRHNLEVHWLLVLMCSINNMPGTANTVLSANSGHLIGAIE